LPARLGAFAILGNHDSDLLSSFLESWGVRMLGQNCTQVGVGDAVLELIGLPGPDRMDLDLEAVGRIPAKTLGTPRVIVSHYPDLIRETAGLGADIFFAGHTHGGQIALPGGYPIIRHDSLPRRFCTGVHRYQRTWLIVNRGLGFTHLPIRLFCPTEVVEVRLKRSWGIGASER
jgi:predicted MPP superfamily phosphohydrolase